MNRSLDHSILGMKLGSDGMKGATMTVEERSQFLQELAQEWLDAFIQCSPLTDEEPTEFSGLAMILRDT